MQADHLDATHPPPPGAWRRLHAALMPDYNRKATVFWWAVVALGAAVLLHAAGEVAQLPASQWGLIAAGLTIAMVAGFFPVQIPHSKNSFAAGEIFIFLLLLISGPAAATVAAAGESAIGAYRTSKRWTSRIASPAMSALAMFAAGSTLDASLDYLREITWLGDGLLIVATMVFSLAYFTLNSLLASALPRLKRNEPFTWAAIVGLFGWVGFAFASSAAVAALVFLTYRQSGIGVLGAVVPLLGMLLATLHYYNRQQEAHEAARQAAAQAAEREALVAAQAAEREADLAARHVQELEASERRFHSAFTHASIGMALLSFEGRVLQANEALRALLGEDEASLRQRTFGDLVADDDRAAIAAQLAHVHDRDFEAFAIELRCRHRDGGVVWVSLHCSYFSEPGSAKPCLILQAQDISARRKAEEGLQSLAFNDALTGLPNRRRFQDLLQQAIARSQADASKRYAVLFLDFDRFKLINDSLGHGAGDQFLIDVSRRIQARLRPHDVVARLGGDEFAILMQEFHDEHAVVLLSERLLQAMGEPLRIQDTEVMGSVSIGVTTSAIGYTDPEAVLRDADIAMYRAKAGGKARYALFDVSLHSDVSQRLRLEGDLRHAIAAGELNVAYQPLFDLQSGRLTGFEALARWNHPEQGVIGPDVFIPIAEESGLIVPLTDLVLRRACLQLREWQGVDTTFAELKMNVNISSRDIAQKGLLTRVMKVLTESGIGPQHLSLELTENILMEQIDSALPLLQELRTLGIELSVDDFGTGYSSLARLSNLPIDVLKVDRSFVSNLRVGSKEATVVKGIVYLGNALGKHIVAEGIETASQLDQLRDMGCRWGQGYHMSRPLHPAQVDALLERIVAQGAPHGRTAAFELRPLLH